MKYAGWIGFSDPEAQEEISPSVYAPKIVRKHYKGDVLRRSWRWQDASQFNRNVNVSNQISIVADPYALKNFGLMAYVEWLGQKWKVLSAEVQPPRIVITMGDLYHEDQQT